MTNSRPRSNEDGVSGQEGVRSKGRPQLLSHFLEASFPAALREAERTFEADAEMVKMMKGGREYPFDEAKAKRWMRNYGLFQGIHADNRTLIIKVIRDIGRARTKSSGIGVDKLVRRFSDAVPRLWLSAASKVGWCLDPENVVIYDSFALRAITVLEAIDPALADYPRLGDPPRPGDPDVVSRYYDRYARQVRAVYQAYAPQIAELSERSGAKYPYPLRIFDKMLWILGSGKEFRGATGLAV